jgi:hypothetical protein
MAKVKTSLRCLGSCDYLTASVMRPTEICVLMKNTAERDRRTTDDGFDWLDVADLTQHLD